VIFGALQVTKIFYREEEKRAIEGSGKDFGKSRRFPSFNKAITSASFQTLPEIWDKMATDMRTLTKYGDQTLL
jgi:hypothetical protein